MTVHDAIGWFQSKLLVNDRFNLHGNQDEAARLALIALIEQEERLQNCPLTLEELREMDEEPVWVERCDSGVSRWAVFGDTKSPYVVYFGTAVGGFRLHYDDYGKTWLAYRRRPEEEKH